MLFTESSVREVIQEPGLDGMLKHIDYCAGICYNRHGLSKSGDSKAFVKSLFERGHGRCLEFGTVNMKVPFFGNDITEEMLNVVHSSYGRTNVNKEKPYLPLWEVTTNFRVMCDNLGFDEALEVAEKYWTGEQFFPRRTFVFTCSRVTADSFRTHVTLSSLMKSTRYVDWGKGGMRFTKPYWFVDGEEEGIGTKEWLFKSACEDAEIRYNQMVREYKMKPQEAREILPLSIETELCLCGFPEIEGEGWKRFLDMRCDPAAHPDAQKLANEVKILLEKN